jgi:hypothetical protein
VNAHARSIDSVRHSLIVGDYGFAWSTQDTNARRPVPGMLADMLPVDGDPLRDVTILTDRRCSSRAETARGRARRSRARCSRRRGIPDR